MNLEDKKRDFIDLYEQRVSWISQAERKMFENDVEDLIITTREEQLTMDFQNFEDMLNKVIKSIVRMKRGLPIEKPVPPPSEIRTEGERPNEEEED